VKRYGLVIFDLDGVLYRGDEPIPGAAQAVSRIESSGAQVRYLTNNSTQTRASFAAKLTALGITAKPCQVFTSAAGAGRLLSGSSAFVIGEEGLRDELRQAGCEVVESGEAECVVVGACWGLTYAMLDDAQWRIRCGARYLATNLDSTFPVEGGRLRPGAGAIVAAVSAASGREPEIVVGKPEPTLVDLILAETKLSKAETLLVGDRMDTDIECARRAGVDSALVLTGVTATATAGQATYVLESVALL
jgi:HAD superfamily hydrolase (TIGR01450 family)